VDQKLEQLEDRHEWTKQELEVIGEYLPQIRRSLSDQSIVKTYLAIAFVLGLIAQVVGYLLKQSVGPDLVGLGVDLLYSLGLALWTGVVITYFVQVLPEAKRRQIIKGLEAYEASRSKPPASRQG
jgi:hypothetical protein